MTFLDVDTTSRHLETRSQGASVTEKWGDNRGLITDGDNGPLYRPGRLLDLPIGSQRPGICRLVLGKVVNLLRPKCRLPIIPPPPRPHDDWYGRG